MTKAKAKRRAAMARERAAIQAAPDSWDLTVSPEARAAERPTSTLLERDGKGDWTPAQVKPEYDPGSGTVPSGSAEHPWGADALTLNRARVSASTTSGTPSTCPVCRGSGKATGPRFEQGNCRVCRGRGTV